MRSRWRILLLVAVAVAGACGDDGVTATEPAPPEPAEPEPAQPEAVEATAFTWVTTLDQAGSGYVLTVQGVVGDGHAASTMHVEPRVGEGGGDGDDFLAALATAAVNGFDEEDGLRTSGGDVSLTGETEVRVLGDARWYRNPWLLDEAAEAMGDAEWVRVPDDEVVLADLATAVLNERYDHALRQVLAAVEAGEPLEAPAPEEDSALDEVLTPWIGLRGPAYPVGAEATVTGGVERGAATWRQTLTREADGIDGTMAGDVEWAPTTAAPPSEPGPAIDVADLTAWLGG